MAESEHDMTTVRGLVDFMREFNAGVVKVVPRAADGAALFAVLVVDGPDADEVIRHMEALETVWNAEPGSDATGSRQTGDAVRTRLADTDGGGGAAVHLDEPVVCEDCDEPVDECACEANAILTKAINRERDRAIRYLRDVLAANHPSIADTFCHAARQLENNAHRIGVSTERSEAPSSDIGRPAATEG